MIISVRIDDIVNVSRIENSIGLHRFNLIYAVPVKALAEDLYAGQSTIKIFLDFTETTLGKSFSAWFVFDVVEDCWRKRRPHNGFVDLQQVPFRIVLPHVES